MSVSLAIFTLFHVLFSLIGIGAGLVVVFGLIRTRWISGWNTLFLVTTTAATLTGFLFPFHKFLPSHAIGIISSTLLAVAAFALYKRQLAERLAADLRGYIGDRSLPQYFHPDRAAL